MTPIFTAGFQRISSNKDSTKSMGIIKMMKMWISWNLLMDQENNCIEFSLVQFTHSVTSDSLRPHGLQHTRLPCPSATPRVCSKSCPLSQWCHPTSHPLSSLSPPAFNLSQHQGLFKWVSSSHQVAKVLEFQLQHQSFQWIFRTDLP